MAWDLNTVINRGSTRLQEQGKYTPRRLNWYVFKSMVRTLGGHGRTAVQWQGILSTSTSNPKTNPWDVYHSLYKNLVVEEPSKSIFSKVGSVVKGATVGLITSGFNPAGALAGGGASLFGGGVIQPPPLLPVEPVAIQPKPILAGFQIPNKKILIGGAIAFGFFSLLTVLRK